MKEVKKYGIIVLIVMVLMTLTACSNNGGDSSDKDGKDTIKPVEDDGDKDEDKDVDEKEEVSEEDKEEVEENNSEETDEYIPNFIHLGDPIDYTQYNFFTADLYVKAPAYHRVSHGLENFHYGKDLTLGYFAGRESDMTRSNIENVEDIMENCGEILVNGTSRYVFGDFESFEFDSIEEMTINGIDMIRYEGNMIVSRTRQDKRYVVAYTFIHNGTPNAIFGVAGEIEQDQEIIDTLIHNVDESVKTIVPKNS